jgi:hypothetical protein
MPTYTEMKRDNTVNIIVPVYKETMTNYEKASLRQCVKILSSYPITLICPTGLNLSLYFSEYSNFNIEYFDPLYFKNISGYSKLMISRGFYRRFKTYKYLLIYHLDAWVFHDKLKVWCSKGYDYIGAPWFEGWDKVEKNAECLGVGNGGLSLRKVKSHLKFTYNPFLWINKGEMFINLFKGGYSDIIRIIPRLIWRIYNNNLQVTRFKFKLHEDNFWSFVVGRNFSSFRIPDVKEASLFSFEYNPEWLYEMTGHKLPFACHKWEMNLDFWIRFIDFEPNDNI